MFLPDTSPSSVASWGCSEPLGAGAVNEANHFVLVTLATKAQVPIAHEQQKHQLKLLQDFFTFQEEIISICSTK